MLKVGITGGIGSGKSTVCRVFSALGIPVFYADEAARALMNSDPALRRSIADLLGESVYTATGLDRGRVAAAVFGNPQRLAALNALVHPATIANGEAWMQAQTTSYAIKEAALFFESGSHHSMDVMIGVDAPYELRMARAVSRGGLTPEAARERADRQMDPAEKMSRCDAVIINDDRQAVLPQVLQLHQWLLDKAKQKAPVQQ